MNTLQANFALASSPAVHSSDATQEPEFLNRYRCPACAHRWSDVWSCGCDDECPSCGQSDISPVSSDEITDTLN